MKKLVIFLCLLTSCALAQNIVPRPNFAEQVAAFHPASYVTFSNLASPFLDSVANANFVVGVIPNVGYVNPVGATGSATGTVNFSSVPSPGGALNQIILHFQAAPTGPCTISIASQSGTSLTITDSFTVTPTATSGHQVFNSGTAFSARSFPATYLIGVTSTATCTPDIGGVLASNYYYKYTGTTPAIGVATTYTYTTSGDFNIAAVVGTGTTGILTGQPGYDVSVPQNYSAAFANKSYLYAPNDTIGDHEWSQPFSLLYQIDNLQWARSGNQYLLTKGNIGVNSTSMWKLYLTMSGTRAEVCFYQQGPLSGGGAGVIESVCSLNATYDLPNGFNYTISVSGDGTGKPYGALTLSVNGTPNAYGDYSNTSNRSFGGFTAVGSGGAGLTTGEQFGVVYGTGGTNCHGYGSITASGGAISAATLTSYLGVYGCTTTPSLAVYPYYVTVTASTGSGYTTNPTAFTSTGGGVGCAIAGTFVTSGGVPTGAVTVTTNSTACTSAPTLVAATPGTGAVLTATTQVVSGTLTATLSGASVSTATIAPMYVNGYWYGPQAATWAPAGNGGSVFMPTPYNMNVDKVVAFSAAASPTQVNTLFYQTNWYKQLLTRNCALDPTPWIVSNDASDADNQMLFAFAIRLHQMHCIDIQGVEQTDGRGTGQALWRQMLDSAGMNHIPITVPATFAQSSASSTTAQIAAYNSATSTTASSYPSSLPMWRRVLANNPSKAVNILIAGATTGYAAFLASGADSISSLTGLQLQQQDQANGGAIYLQGMCIPNPTCSTGDNITIDATSGAYMMSNTGSPSIPMYWYADIPNTSGGGIASTRTANDPLYIYANSIGSALPRSAFDSFPMAAQLSPFFCCGVTVAVSGGTGYANPTYFTSTGGGSGCNVTGNFVTSGGVPTGVVNFDTNGGGPAIANFGGGYGCTNYSSPPTIVPTAPTGTGATLTATPLSGYCMTVTVSGGSAHATTASCNNQYQYFINSYSDAPYPPFLSWFLDSLMDAPPTPRPVAQ
jgi:hypothetical protein